MRTPLVAVLATLALVGVTAEAALPKRSAPVKRASVAQKEFPPFEMRGHRIGDPKPREEKYFNQWGYEVPPPIKREKFGDVEIFGGLQLEHDETGLTGLMGLFNSYYAENLRTMFIAKYGPPTSTKETIARNGFGREAPNKITEWRFKEGTLTLYEVGSTLENGFFVFRNPAAEARAKAKAASRDLEAAKGL